MLERPRLFHLLPRTGRGRRRGSRHRHRDRPRLGDPRHFDQIKDNFLSAVQRLLCFYAVMSPAKGATVKAATWSAAPDHIDPPPRKRSRKGPDDGATSVRAVIASSAFLMLFAGTLLIGGHAAIDPLLRSVTAARETLAVGDVVYTMPDGKFCRHMSFDNATAEMTEGAIAPCQNDIARNRPRDSRGFAWGEH